MKRIFLLLSVLALVNTANAQVLDWAKNTTANAATSGISQIRSAADANGAVYISGDLYGTVDMDPGPGNADLTSYSLSVGAAAVAKYSSTGQLLWAKEITGKSTSSIKGIALDDTGNIYLTGYFIDSVDFDMGAGDYSMYVNPNYYATFIAKYDSNGSFKWAQQINLTSANAIALDAKKGIYITGTFAAGYNVDFDPGAGTTTLTTLGVTDAFVAAYDNAGAFRFVKQIGGPTNTWAEVPVGIGVKNDRLYVTGMFNGTADFNPPAMVDTLAAVGGNSSYDLFIVKYDTAGNFGFVKGISGGGSETFTGFSLDTAGNILVAGQFNGTDSADFDPSANTYMLKSITNVGGFFAKYAANGDLTWAKVLTSHTGGVYGPMMALDIVGNIHLYGAYYWNMDTDPSADTTLLSSQNGTFYGKYNASGTLMYSSELAKNVVDDGGSIVISGISDVVISGHSIDSVDCDLGANVNNLYTSNYEFFVAKYRPDCSNFSIHFDSLYNLQNPCPDAHLTLNGLMPMTVNVAWSFGESTLTANTSVYPVPGVCPENYIVTVLDANGCMDTLHFTVQTLDVKDMQAGSVYLFPNPVRDNLYIQLADMNTASLEIYTMTGALLQKATLSSSLNTLNISQLSAGMYMLRLSTDKGMYNSRLIKQ